MSIIGALPVTLTNGTTADASQVMADLNFIVNAVNAGAQPAGNYSTAGTLDAPSGTRMSFHQATAPTGWVTDSTINNHTCLYSPSGGQINTSGRLGYLSFVSAGWASDSHSLTVAEIPAHTHSFAMFAGSGGNSGPQSTIAGNAQIVTTDGGTGGGGGHTHTITQQFQYITMCIAQKS
ncbi:hypothetical protein [Paraburkholderia sp.]|uniref:hypothetical protein n=1 Tax=Paraburkholderia sp. TaxID=1926495 RepID=UPI0039E2A6A7